MNNFFAAVETKKYNIWRLFPAFLGLDVVSKFFALHYIPGLRWGGYPFGGIPVFENFFGISFSLNLVMNTGAAWGFFQGHSGALFLLRVAIILGLGLYFFFFSKRSLLSLSFVLIAVGALGNTIDYLLYGAVVDFVHFVFWGYSFPVFNIADACVTLGAIGFIIKRYDSPSLSNRK